VVAPLQLNAASDPMRIEITALLQDMDRVSADAVGLVPNQRHRRALNCRFETALRQPGTMSRAPGAHKRFHLNRITPESRLAGKLHCQRTSEVQITMKRDQA
jgi:hypothetical protein